MNVTAKNPHTKETYAKMCKAIDLSSARELEKERMKWRIKRIPEMMRKNNDNIQ